MDPIRSGPLRLRNPGSGRAFASPSSDAEVRAAFLFVNDLGVVLLRDQVHQVLGMDPLARSGMERWTAQVLDVYSRGVLTIGEVPSSETDPPRGAV